MMFSHRHFSGRNEDGLTTMELLILVFVGGIVAAVIAGTFISAMRANAGTRDRDVASGIAQVVSTSIASNIRTASAFVVESTGTGASTKIVLRAVVAQGTSGWECRAWGIADLDGDGKTEVRYRAHPTGTVVPFTSSWTVLAKEVSQVKAADGTLRPYFAKTSDLLQYSILVHAAEQKVLSDGAQVPVTGSATARARLEGAPPTCW